MPDDQTIVTETPDVTPVSAYGRSKRGGDPVYEERIYRLPATDAIELRAKPDGSPLIVGYGAVFNRQSSVITEWGGSFIERINPGAFTKTLRENGDVLGTFNHDMNYILGRGSNGTLRMSQDSQGLEYQIDPTPTQWARDLCNQIDRGDIKGASFGFRAIRDAWGMCDGPDSKPIDERTLFEVQLYDVGPVAVGAYPDASSALRSLLAADIDPKVVRSILDAIAELRTDLQSLRRYLPAESVAAPGAPAFSGHPPTIPQPAEPIPPDHSAQTRLDRLARLNQSIADDRAIRLAALKTAMTQ